MFLKTFETEQAYGPPKVERLPSLMLVSNTKSTAKLWNIVEDST